MTYVRKTKDEWIVEGYYSCKYGWEEVYVADTRAEAISVLKDYLTNEPYDFRIIKKRSRITDHS